MEKTRASFKKLKIEMQRERGQYCLYRIELWGYLDVYIEEYSTSSEWPNGMNGWMKQLYFEEIDEWNRCN